MIIPAVCASIVTLPAAMAGRGPAEDELKKKIGSVFSLLQVRKQEFREETAPRAVQ